jgi:hypothetical protein
MRLGGNLNIGATTPSEPGLLIFSADQSKAPRSAGDYSPHVFLEFQIVGLFVLTGRAPKHANYLAEKLLRF